MKDLGLLWHRIHSIILFFSFLMSKNVGIYKVFVSVPFGNATLEFTTLLQRWLTEYYTYSRL